MRGKCIVLLFVSALILSAVKSVHSSVIINEILADPPAGSSGDANGDGVRSSKEDEFVELFNMSYEAIDVSNWFLTDASAIRHVFGSNSLVDPLSAFVVFAGGAPAFEGFHWQTSSTDNLGLNNDGDTVSLFDAAGNLIDRVVYGLEAGNDQSIVRSVEGTESGWIKHSDLQNSQGKIYSSGYLVNKKKTVDLDNLPVPEPATILALLIGLGWMYFFKRE